jgi:hypothetical protein
MESDGDAQMGSPGSDESYDDGYGDVTSTSKSAFCQGPTLDKKWDALVGAAANKARETQAMIDSDDYDDGYGRCDEAEASTAYTRTAAALLASGLKAFSTALGPSCPFANPEPYNAGILRIPSHATRVPRGACFGAAAACARVERHGVSPNQDKELRLKVSTLQGGSKNGRVRTAAAELGLQLTKSAVRYYAADLLPKTERVGLSRKQAKELRLMASTLQGDSATSRVKTAAAELGLQLTKHAITSHATRLVKTERAGLSTNMDMSVHEVMERGLDAQVPVQLEAMLPPLHQRYLEHKVNEKKENGAVEQKLMELPHGLPKLDEILEADRPKHAQTHEAHQALTLQYMQGAPKPPPASAWGAPVGGGPSFASMLASTNTFAAMLQTGLAPPANQQPISVKLAGTNAFSAVLAAGTFSAVLAQGQDSKDKLRAAGDKEDGLPDKKGIFILRQSPSPHALTHTYTHTHTHTCIHA